MVNKKLIYVLSLLLLAFSINAEGETDNGGGGDPAEEEPTATTTLTPYPTSTPNDLLDGWGVCPECDFCIARNEIAKCFFVIHGVTWLEAKQHCQNMSAELATVRSSLETRFLNRTKSILGIGWSNAWIGLRWKAQANAWLWVDDVPIKSYQDYNLFAPGEPGQSWASCVEFIARDIYQNYLGYYTGYWKVQHCTEKRAAICQYYKQLVPEAP